MFRGAFAIFACAACAEVADSGPNVRGPEVGVGENRVDANGLILELATEGVRLPTSLRLGATELLAGGACTSASKIGVGLLPMQNVTAGPRAGVEAAQNTAQIRGGPVVGEIDVAYAVPYSCNAPEGPQTVAGTSTFRVFPRGRIVRRDEVRAAAMEIQNAAVCRSCNAGTTISTATVEAFWTFAGTGMPTTNGRESCVDLETHTIAVRWLDSGTVRHVASASAIAFTYEAYTPMATIPAAQHSTQSVMVIESGSRPCAELLAKLNPPELVIARGDERKTLQLDENLIYTDSMSHSGRFEIRTADGAALDSGFALQLAIGNPDHLVVENRAGVPVTYTLQTVEEETLLWIDDGIAAGDAVIIEVL